MESFLLKVLDKLDEKTTWLAIFAALNYVGVKIAPEYQGAIIDVGLPLIALALLVAKDFKTKKEQEILEAAKAEKPAS